MLSVITFCSWIFLRSSRPFFGLCIGPFPFHKETVQRPLCLIILLACGFVFSGDTSCGTILTCIKSLFKPEVPKIIQPFFQNETLFR